MQNSEEFQHIYDFIAHIEPYDVEAREQARQRQQLLTKPAGSLGRLEELVLQVAGITGNPVPEQRQKAVIVLAGDHGVTAEGVSAYPSSVTAQMVQNFLRGGAAINAFARQIDARVVVVDIGVAATLHHPELLSHKIAFGTENMTKTSAMTKEQVVKAILTGIEVLTLQRASGVNLVATGEMGIGNTTIASALTAAMLGLPVAQVTGKGTGVNDAQLAHKIQVIESALSKNTPDPHNPLDVLMKIGGLEIAGLVGVILGAASYRIPIVLDGFISGSAALIARALCPRISSYLIAGHISAEPGHAIILNELDLLPLLSLDLRLGEGTGAVLAMNLIEGALRMHREMHTFQEAGVSTRQEQIDEIDSPL